MIGSPEIAVQRLEAETARLGEHEIWLPDNVNVCIYFSPHEKADNIGDQVAFRDLVRAADILIPEAAGWNQTQQKLFQQASKGNYEARSKLDALFQTQNIRFLREVLRHVYKSQAVVRFLDVGVDSPLFESCKYVKQAVDKLEAEEMQPSITRIRNLSTYVDTTNKIVDIKVPAHKYRERLWATSLGPTVADIIKANPKLAAKEPVNVVMTLGDVHTSFYYKLRQAIPGDEARQRITRLFGEPNPIFSGHYQIMRSGLFDIELNESAKQSLVVRDVTTYFIKSIVAQTAPSLVLNDYQLRLLTRKVSSKFGVSEVDELLQSTVDEELIDHHPIFKKLTELVMETVVKLGMAVNAEQTSQP